MEIEDVHQIHFQKIKSRQVEFSRLSKAAVVSVSDNIVRKPV